MPRGRRTEPVRQDSAMDASQASSDGGDMFGMVVAEQYLAKSEKKNKDSRAKFLTTAKKDLRDELSAESVEFQSIMRNEQERYDAFTIAFAANQDQTRRLLLEIQGETEKMNRLVQNSKEMVAKQFEKKERETGLVHASVACLKEKPVSEDLMMTHP